ncbi:MAG: MASE1 domain-containing protein, partial [Candidatus Sungbacteria bacterium]|nr:MASE1 domain-containing protein [Candidatus Sungbacteria bacterium]
MKRIIIYLLSVFLFVAIYGIGTWFSIFSLLVSGFASVIWIPAGVALAVLFLYGFRLWPGIFIGAFFAYFFHGAPFSLALIMGIGSTLEVLVGFYVLKHLYFESSLQRFWDVIVLVVAAAAMSTFASTVIGIAGMMTGNAGHLVYLHTWTWWIGDMLGIILISPFLFIWSGGMGNVTFKRRRLFECGTVLLFIFSFAAMLAATGGRFSFFAGLPYAINLLATQLLLCIFGIAMLALAAFRAERMKMAAQLIKEGSHIKTFFEWLAENAPSIAIFAAILLPVILLTTFGLVRTYEDSTRVTFSERKAIAQLAANVLSRQFDRLVDVGVALTDRRQLKESIIKGNWQEAIKNFQGIEKEFPYLDLAVLFTREGILKDATITDPRARGTIGQSTTFRDWWQGAYRHGNWAPHVSEVFKRAPLPQLNVIVVAIPIRSDEKVIGVLMLQVNLQTMLSWSGDINVGKDAFVYFVDQNGHVAGHPKYPSEAPIQNYSSLDIVQKIHRGQSGVEIFYNSIEKEERFIAYEPVSKYGWGVIVSQDKAAAFAIRDRELSVGILFDMVIIICALFLSFFISQSRRQLSYYAKGLKGMVEERTKKLAEAQARDHAILMNMGEGLAVTDKNNKIIFVSRSFEKLLGWRSEEVIGKDFDKIVSKEDVRGTTTSFKEMPLPRVLQEEDMLISAATFYFSKNDKTKFPVSLIVAPIIVNGETIGFIETFRDITEQMRIDEAKTEFISLASHQLRTPLSAIRWLSESLTKKEKLALSTKQYIEDIHFSALRMEKLVE